MEGRSQRPKLSVRLLATEIPGARKAVPVRALVLSVAALAVAAWGALSSPDILAGYDALSWLLALIPAYLLAYYRGWRGASHALAGGTLLVLLVELVAEHVMGMAVDWTLLFLVSVALVGLGLGLGVLAELLERERRDALLLAYTDPLTGLANERLLDFVLEKEFAAARRGRPLSVVLFDIDGFGESEELRSSEVRESVVRRVASCIERYLRRMNVSGRQEGTRFLSILSGENVDGAWVYSDRVRQLVSEQRDPNGEPITVSIGIGSYEPWMRQPSEMVDAAARGLREARALGGNRVVYVEAEEPGVLAAADEREVSRGWRRRTIEEAEIRYRGLFDGVPVGLYRFSPEGHILDANPALVRILGYPDRESLVATRAFEHYVDGGERGLWQLSLGPETPLLDREVRLRRQDGTTIWARDRARAVLGRGGEVKHYQGALIDITERKDAQEQLASSNTKLRALIEAAPVAVVGLDAEGRVTIWNSAAEGIFGWGEAEALGKPLPFIGPDEEDEARRLRDRVMRGEPVSGVEVSRRRKDGTEVDIALWASPLRDVDGSISGLLGIAADVTEQRRTEQERTLLAAAVEQVAEAIVITDVEGTIQYVNPAFERITGYSRSEVFGRNPRLLKSGKHSEAYYRELWDALSRGWGWTGQFHNKKKDGTIYRQETTISPVRSVGGEIVNYVGVARDVTREVELESQLRQGQRMEAIGQLAGGIAHDFNNLLQAVMGSAEMLLLDPEDSAAIRELAAEIKEAGSRASALTRQLLAFSRRQVLEMERLDLNSVVSAVERMIGRLIGENVELVTRLAPDLWSVSADRGQMEQIIVNLAVNARDAMPEGGRLIMETGNVVFDDAYVELHNPARPGRFVMIAISDTGVGMDEETRSRIFEPFFTTKELGKGTGLGLATVYGIVKQSDGYIWVYSEPGEGSTFKIYVPAVDEDGVSAADEDSAVVTDAEPVEGRVDDVLPNRSLAAHRTETVLIVDDDAGVRAILQRILATAGYTVLEASTPGEALRLADETGGGIDVLITDMVMPELQGPELAARVARRQPGVAVIYVSGYTDVSLQDRVPDPSALITKPFSRDSLLRKVREVLKASEGREDREADGGS